MTNTIAAIPAHVHTAYAAHGLDVDAIAARATADQCSGVSINAGRTWAADTHGPRAAVLYMEAWLASMKINGPAPRP